jgi:threonine synthase
MKSILLASAVVLFATTSCQSQINNAETVKVYGNCDMCETTIEKAANKKKYLKPIGTDNITQNGYTVL